MCSLNKENKPGLVISARKLLARAARASDKPSERAAIRPPFHPRPRAPAAPRTLLQAHIQPHARLGEICSRYAIAFAAFPPSSSFRSVVRPLSGRTNVQSY